jgi:predicted DCC family thiol-disulfide oxidoreductase YuxK
MVAEIEPPVLPMLLFDGDCGVCTYLADRARKIDRAHQFKIEPFQSFSEQELLRFGLDYKTCSLRLQVVSHSGRIFSGAHGVNYFLFKQFPWSILVILVYVVPVFLLLEMIGYGLVAKNREKISSILGLEGCVIKR